MPFSPVEEIIEDVKAGKMVIVCDDENRENEGDLTMAAELVTADDINFMATHGKGLICLPMSGQLIDRLQIPEMTRHNVPQTETAFTASIEARYGITTGISAADRAHTCRVASSEATGPQDLVMPGHVFPLRARDGGVMERPGQTESAVDLARLSGLRPAGVICEIMKEDGTMARVPDLEKFSREHGIKMVTVEQLIEHRSRYESHVEFVVETRLPTGHGEFRALAYESKLDGLTHVALVKGEPEGKEEVLVRLHSSCLTGDALHSLRCDCGQQLEAAMKRVAEEGEGVIVYLQQNPDDTGMLDELEPHLQGERGLTPKTYEGGSRILEHLNISSVRFVTDAPDGAELLEGFGPAVSGTESLTGPANGNGRVYPNHPGNALH